MSPGSMSQFRWLSLIFLMLYMALVFGQTESTMFEVLKEPKETEIRPIVPPRSEPTANMSEQQEGNVFSAFLTNDYSKYKSIEVVATGYYAGKESTGKTPGHPQYGITYSGVKVRRSPELLSTIAADPNLFPIGTVLYIPGYGLGVVADTGGAIKGNKIDLYFATKEQVYREWGKKTVHVVEIMRGDGKLTEVMVDGLNQLLHAGKKAIPSISSSVS